MSVFLRKQNLKKGQYLSFVESTYSKEKKNAVQKVIKKIGYTKDLEKIYSNPIEYFEEEAKKLSLVSQEKYHQEKEEKIPRKQTIKNLGYFPIARLYKEFKFKDEFEYLKQNHNFKFDLEKLFRFLVYSQIITPGSKKHEYENKDLFFDNFDFSDDQMYDGINYIGKNVNYIKQHIIYELQKIYKPNVDYTYFDCTNIYFEIDKENEFQRRGPEKNNRHDPIIGLGLLMDSKGIPLSYTTFPGNQSEQTELHKNAISMKKDLNITGRTIYVADKGLNCGDNMQKAIEKGDGYVIGQKVRDRSENTLKWILEEEGYKITTDENGVITFKIKSEVDNYKVDVTSKLNGQKVTINMKQKRVLFYSKDYADKKKLEREKLIAKAYDLINNPKKYKRKNIGDAATYITDIKFDKNGEIVSEKLFLDEERIKEEEQYDGFYMIVTSETNLDDDKIIEIYRGLWEIEETFSIIKGVLKVRPIFAKTIDGIEAHLLVCFTSLLILRLLQKIILKDELTPEQLKEIEKANKKKKKHKIRIEKWGEQPMKKIVNFMRTFNAQEINNSYYIGFYNPLIALFEEKYKLILDKHRQSKNDIEKIFDCKFTTHDCF